MVEHYVEYLYLFMGSEGQVSETYQVAERDYKKIVVPERCLAFRFYDLVNEKPTNVSGWYWINCEKIRIEDAPKEFAGHLNYEYLVRYMKTNGVEYIVKTPTNHYIPLRDVDTIIQP